MFGYQRAIAFLPSLSQIVSRRAMPSPRAHRSRSPRRAAVAVKGTTHVSLDSDSDSYTYDSSSRSSEAGAIVDPAAGGSDPVAGEFNPATGGSQAPVPHATPKKRPCDRPAPAAKKRPCVRPAPAKAAPKPRFRRSLAPSPAPRSARRNVWQTAIHIAWEVAEREQANSATASSSHAESSLPPPRPPLLPAAGGSDGTLQLFPRAVASQAASTARMHLIEAAGGSGGVVCSSSEYHVFLRGLPDKARDVPCGSSGVVRFNGGTFDMEVVKNGWFRQRKPLVDFLQERLEGIDYDIVNPFQHIVNYYDMVPMILHKTAKVRALDKNERCVPGGEDFVSCDDRQRPIVDWNNIPEASLRERLSFESELSVSKGGGKFWSK